MTTSNNQLPIDKQPTGDLCIPVSVPNDTEWLWLLAKCLSFPTSRRFWKNGLSETDIKLVMDEWDSRVYNPVVEKILAGDLCAELSEDNCLDYPSNHGMIDYQPMNPFVDPDEVPAGYLLPPFVRYADLLLEDLPDWLADLVAEITGEFTGYEPNDVLSLIGSFPLDITEWEGALTNGLPRFTVTVQDKGTLELHLLGVPFGSRALISLDVEPNIGDIFAGIISGDINIVELNRDLSSIPPETNVELIHEVEITTIGEHIVHVTFVPAANDELIPISFGGGVRSVTWCPNNIPDPEPCPDCDIETILEDDEFFNDEYIPKVFGEKYTGAQDRNTDLETAYDTTPQSIGSEIPTGAPNEAETNALCAALIRFVKLYCSEKTCLIQSRNFFEVAWDNLEDAAESFYGNFLDKMLGSWSDNLFGCIVDVPTALTVLADTAAQEDLACYLLTELDGGAISETAFTTAIDNAATTLTGNEQLIACVMTEDYELNVYLNFLQAYNTALLQQDNNQDVDCPCISASYKHWKHDFADGMGTFRPTYFANGVQQGTVTGGHLEASVINFSTMIVQVTKDIDPTWRIYSCRVLFQNSVGSSTIMRWRVTPDNNTGALNPSIGTGGAVAPYSSVCQGAVGGVGYLTNVKQFFLNKQIVDAGGVADDYIRIKSVEIIYSEDFAEGGTPTADDNLCV